MSSNKVLTAVLVILLAAVAIGIFTIAAKKRAPGEESSAESLSETSQIAFVPSLMPTRITLQLPPGFSATSSEAYDIYYVLRDASIIVTGEKIVIGGEQVEHYAETVLEQYRKTADNFQLMKQEQFDVNGVQCVTVQFRYDIVAPDAKQGMECMTGILIKDNRSYIITCKSHVETFAGYMDAFRSAIRSAVIADEPVAGTASAPAPQSELTQTTAVSNTLQP